MENNVDRRRFRRPVDANRLTHSAPDAIPLDCTAQHASYGKTDPDRRSRFFRPIRPPQEEYSHVSGKLPAAKFVHPLKVRTT